MKTPSVCLIYFKPFQKHTTLHIITFSYRSESSNLSLVVLDGFRASSLNFIWILKSNLGMYDEPPTNKQGIQTNAELFVIQNMVV